MKIFVDTAKLEEIEQAKKWGVMDGVTTNPSLVKKVVEGLGKDTMESYLKKILTVAKGTPVSLEVIGSTYEEMVEEGKKLYEMFNPIANNVVIKVPVNPAMEEGSEAIGDGIKTVKAFSDAGIPVNCTLIFTPEQALLAAKAGAKYVSPFAGRVDDDIRNKAGIKFEKTDYYPAEGKEKDGKLLEDNGILSGVDLVQQIVQLFGQFEVSTEVLAASIRNARQARECWLVGADVATLPFKVIKQLLNHHKTIEGMQKFTKDIVPEYKKLIKGN